MTCMLAEFLFKKIAHCQITHPFRCLVLSHFKPNPISNYFSGPSMVGIGRNFSLWFLAFMILLNFCSGLKKLWWISLEACISLHHYIEWDFSSEEWEENQIKKNFQSLILSTSCVFKMQTRIHLLFLSYHKLLS